MKNLIGFLLLSICCTVQASIPAWTSGYNTEHNLAGQPSWNAEGSLKGRLQDVGDQTTYATLGGGTVTKKSGEQHDLTNVNRDLNNTQEITLDQQTAGLDATVTVDHRLLSEGGRNAIKKDFDETGTLMQEVDNVIPSANNENQVLAGIGKTLDVLSTITGGIIPADATEGGLIAQIPILIGQEDIKHEVIGEGNKVYANGIMNNLENAKQGADNIIGEGDKQIWWNPSRGIVSDLLESSVDLLNGIGLQTGISKQAERFQKENEGKEFYLHSQAHIIFKEGAANTGAGNTYNSYGSPLPKSTVVKTFTNEDGDIGQVQKNDGDYVANPQNIFNPSTWSKPGHGTENYGAARDKKLIGGGK